MGLTSSWTARPLVRQHASEPERLISRLVGLLVQKLPQAGVVGILLVGGLDRLSLDGEVFVGLRDVHRPHVTDALLGRAQYGWALLHQLFCELGDGVLQLLGRHRVVDHADARRLLAVERLAEAGIVERVARKHRVGHRLRDQGARQDAPVDLGERKGRILGCDRKVAGEQLHECTADAIAVHHGDGGLVVVVEPLPSPPVGGGGRLLALAGVPLQLAEKFLEILAGAEITALAAHHHDADIIVHLEPRQRIIHVVMKLRAHGIALVRTIEGRPGDTVVDSDIYELVLVIGHRCRSLCVDFDLRQIRASELAVYCRRPHWRIFRAWAMPLACGRASIYRNCRAIRRAFVHRANNFDEHSALLEVFPVSFVSPKCRPAFHGRSIHYDRVARILTPRPAISAASWEISRAAGVFANCQCARNRVEPHHHVRRVLQNRRR